MTKSRQVQNPSYWIKSANAAYAALMDDMPHYVSVNLFDDEYSETLVQVQSFYMGDENTGILDSEYADGIVGMFYKLLMVAKEKYPESSHVAFLCMHDDITTALDIVRLAHETAEMLELEVFATIGSDGIVWEDSFYDRAGLVDTEIVTIAELNYIMHNKTQTMYRSDGKEINVGG